MNSKDKNVIKLVLGVVFLITIWLVLIVVFMRNDIQCVRGNILYNNHCITDLEGCVFNDCELQGGTTLKVTGPDPYIVFDSIMPGAIWVREIFLDMPDSENGVQTIKWYWNFGQGYEEVPWKTTIWNVDKKVHDLSVKLNRTVCGMRMDIEYCSEDDIDLGRIVINKMTHEELKQCVISCFIYSVIAVVLILAMLISVYFLKKDNYFVWIIKGIVMEAVCFVLLPIYYSYLPSRIKIAAIIINIFLSALIACIGVSKNECEE